MYIPVCSFSDALLSGFNARLDNGNLEMKIIFRNQKRMAKIRNIVWFCRLVPDFLRFITFLLALAPGRRHFCSITTQRLVWKLAHLSNFICFGSRHLCDVTQTDSAGTDLDKKTPDGGKAQ